MELISVIVPVYKVEKYLDECIQSIVNQTYKNLEIILVDDGSTDRCPEICDEWAKKDSRVRVIHQENLGLSAARNAGLDIAQGDYIGFVDSDDYIADDMYEQLIRALKDSDKKMACCLIARVFDDGRIVSDKPTSEKNEIMGVDRSINNIFYKKISIAVWCKLYKKTVFDNIRFPVGEVNEDYPIIVPVVVNADGMVLVNKVLYYYRKREGSITAFGYATSRNAGFMYKNILHIKKQLLENNINCNKSYSFFVASNAYDMALVMEKNRNKLDRYTMELLKYYKAMMRKRLIVYICSRYSSIKNKVLYLLVITKMLRPLYRILNKPLY